MKKIAVIGVGNLLMKDDGVGIHAIQALKDTELPDSVQLYDCSTMAFDVLEAMDQKDTAVIIDAYIQEKEPGTVTVFTFDKDHYEDAPNLSMHDFTFIDALKSGQDAFDLPSEITVIGVEPKEMVVDDSLSPEIAEAIPEIVEKVKEIVAAGLV